VDRLTATIYGRVAFTRTDGDPDLIRVRVRQVRISNDWWVRPARGVTIVVPADATVTRRSQSGAVTATTLGRGEAGERVVVATTEFPQTLWFARAAPGVHTARAVQFRGA
jgi:hypothetical protein